MTTYQDLDMAVLSERLNNVLQGSGTDVYRLRQRVQDAEMAGKMNTVSGVLRAQTEDTYDKTASFQTTTDMLAQMNEAYNANRYIRSNLTAEHRRVARLDAEARKEMWKVRQRFLGTRYHTSYVRFKERVVLASMALTVVLMLLAALWRQGTLWTWLFVVLVGLLVLAFAVLLIARLRRNGMRRKMHWNQYYWRVTGDAANETKRATEAGGTCGTDTGSPVL